MPALLLLLLLLLLLTSPFRRALILTHARMPEYLLNALVTPRISSMVGYASSNVFSKQQEVKEQSIEDLHDGHDIEEIEGKDILSPPTFQKIQGRTLILLLLGLGPCCTCTFLHLRACKNMETFVCLLIQKIGNALTLLLKHSARNIAPNYMFDKNVHNRKEIAKETLTMGMHDKQAKLLGSLALCVCNAVQCNYHTTSSVKK
eukprot:1157770-Pelagomonas_calceolata.AAC.4